MLQTWWSHKSSNNSGEWLELLLNKAIIRAGDAGSQSEQEEGSERAEGKSLNSAKKTLQISESHHQIRGNRHCQCHLFYKKILLGLKKLRRSWKQADIHVITDIVTNISTKNSKMARNQPKEPAILHEWPVFQHKLWQRHSLEKLLHLEIFVWKHAAESRKQDWKSGPLSEASTKRISARPDVSRYYSHKSFGPNFGRGGSYNRWNKESAFHAISNPCWSSTR